MAYFIKCLMLLIREILDGPLIAWQVFVTLILHVTRTHETVVFASGRN